MAENKQFLGRGWSFPPSFERGAPGQGSRVCMVAAGTDIHQSLVILLSTVPGERVMLPGYGCPFERHLFDSIDQHTLTQIESMIRDAVLRYEPRILLEDVQFDTGGALDGELRITLVYLIRATNTRSNMVFPFYLREGTNVRRIAP
jgi:phage baseplate assembly protein W